MNYYLRTLEGLGNLRGVVGEYAIEAYKKELDAAKQTPGIKISDAFVMAWNNYLNSPILKATLVTLKENENELNRERLQAVRDFIISYDSGDGVIKNIANKLYNSFSIKYYNKNKINITEHQDKIEREEATRQRTEAGEAVETLKRYEQEELAAQAAQEIERYEALRDEILNNIKYIENGQMILTTPEQMQIYKELTGRDYSEILEHDDEAAAIYESEVEKMNEQNIDISPVVISSQHEYTIIDEDDNTITYQDETGAVYVEPKASAATWLILAAAAALFLA